MLKDLTYKVIVIDDEEEPYEDYVEHIEEKLSDEGYILIHERYEELDDLNDSSISDVDLFLVDLKFGKEDKGPDFIRKIRENQLTDILFYSSDSTSIESYRTSGNFQGVFFAVRDENKAEVFVMIDQLIAKMIKRSNTPISTRGIVLGGVAEIDNIIKAKIALLIGKMEQDKKVDILEKCLKVFYDSFKGQSSKITDFFGSAFDQGLKEWSDVKASRSEWDLIDLINNIKVTDSNKNFRVLLKIYKKAYGEDDTYNTIKTLINLLNDRNILAHVQDEQNDDHYYQFKRPDGDEFLILSEDICKQLRSSIINYGQAISRIE